LWLESLSELRIFLITMEALFRRNSFIEYCNWDIFLGEWIKNVQYIQYSIQHDRGGQHLSMLHFQLTGSPHNRIPGINPLETKFQYDILSSFTSSRIHRPQVQSNPVHRIHACHFQVLFSLLPNEIDSIYNGDNNLISSDADTSYDRHRDLGSTLISGTCYYPCITHAETASSSEDDSNNSPQIDRRSVSR